MPGGPGKQPGVLWGLSRPGFSSDPELCDMRQVTQFLCASESGPHEGHMEVLMEPHRDRALMGGSWRAGRVAHLEKCPLLLQVPG